MIARLYRLALRAFPKRHRDLYTAEMIDAFEQQLANRRRAGFFAVCAFVCASLTNLVTSGIAERRRHHVVRFGYFFSALDFTLAWRMMRRYPGLTLVSIFGMAVGIAIAAGAFAIISALIEVKLPLPEGQRIVSVIVTNRSLSGHEWRMVHDFAAWRNATAFADIGLSHQIARNLIIDGHVPEPVTVAEISPSAFRIAGVDAFRGRAFIEDDARIGADEVVVIGYDEWWHRFDGDPNVVGRSIRLGGTVYTIVGVMPDGFAFPSNQTFWIPWRNDPALYRPLTGPNVTVFAKLAPGATLESANAELMSFGQREAAASPATHEHLRPLVIPYTYAFNDMGDPENHLVMGALQLSVTLLLVLVCVNVAILVYARTATRTGEIAVRGALGASRRRIVAQLFVEALTLAAVAAIIGVLMVSMALPVFEDQMRMVAGGRLPFWMHFNISSDDLIALVAFTLLSATIVGVLPALKATGMNVQARLQTLSAGGGARMQMGPLWTTLIVAQVALTVTVLPAAMFFTWDGLRLRPTTAGFASGQFVSATLTHDRSSEPATSPGDAAFLSRFAAEHAELDKALRANPAVVDVTYSLVSAGEELAMVLSAEDRPLPADPADYNIVDGTKAGHLVRYNRVATNFFDAFDVPIVLGRGFTAADLGTDHVIVDRRLADNVFGGGNPLGRRVKYVGHSREAGFDAMALDRWFEIVGVVPGFPDNALDAEPQVYHPASYGDIHPVRIGVRVRAADPASFTNTLRNLAATVNPNLQLREITTIEMIVKQEQGLFRMIGFTVGLVMMSVIALSAAGIYALMSFTVAKRRREIGIRAALGADRNRLLIGIFSRALAQVGAGVAIGMIGAFGLEQILEGEMLQGFGVVILPVVALVMTVTGVLATIGPARQGLGIQPIEALRDE